MHSSSQKLTTFQNLVSCVHNIQLTTFDAQTFEPLTDATDGAPILYFLLSLDNGASPWWTPEGTNFDRLQTDGHFRPIVCTNSLGMVWISEIEPFQGKPYRIHVFGPVFVSDVSMQSVLTNLQGRNLSAGIRERVVAYINDIPVVSTIRFYEYGLMLHWCLTDEKISISDLMYVEAGNQRNIASEGPSLNSHGTYFVEQKMLQAVREGNLQYEKQLNHLASTGYTGQIIAKDHLRHVKNYVIIHTALCCRTAVEGGLDIEVAYTLSDQYLESIEAADGISSLHEISKAMVRDYVERVHRLHTDSCISPKIRTACELIDLDPQRHTIHSLAQRYGCSDYYFSRIFKKETGYTVQAYILKKKMEQAKQLLYTEDCSIAEISEILGIESPSYFSSCFRKATGVTPLQYRNHRQKDQ